MTREVWLRGNLRAHWLGAAPSVLAAIIGFAILFNSTGWLGRLVGWGLVLSALVWTCMAIVSAFVPRLAYRDGRLLVYLRAGRPIQVPIDVVECFFLGQAPSLLRTGRDPDESAAASSVVVRLAESAAEWKRVSVSARLGRWCDGYITIRGTWCEPLTPELMKSLNHRLAEVHRQRKSLGTETHDAATG